MHIHVLITFGPLDLDVVTGTQLRCIVRESLPAPSVKCSRIFDPMPSVALESACDQEPALPCRSPQAFGAVPRIEQDMGDRPGDWLKGADHRFHQVNQAFERHSFRFADRRLSIQLGGQWTTSSQQHIQALKQAMTWHTFVLGRRMMHPQSFHLLAFAFLNRRVIEGHIPCYDGLLGTASTLRLLLALSLQFCCHLRLHHVTKVPQPEGYYQCCFPRSFREIPAQSCQARPIRNLTHQSRERSSALDIRISPSSTITKYWYCGLENSFTKRSAKWRTCSSRHIMRTGIGHLHGFKGGYSSP